MTNSIGRKSHQPGEYTRRQVKTLAGMGIPVSDIASVIGISTPTLRKHYAEELAVGQIEANAKVAQSLFRQATGDRPNVAAAIFWLKCRGGWREFPDPSEKPGKKEVKQEAAGKAVTGRFAPGAPPPFKVVKS